MFIFKWHTIEKTLHVSVTLTNSCLFRVMPSANHFVNANQPDVLKSVRAGEPGRQLQTV